MKSAMYSFIIIAGSICGMLQNANAIEQESQIDAVAAGKFGCFCTDQNGKNSRIEKDASWEDCVMMTTKTRICEWVYIERSL